MTVRSWPVITTDSFDLPIFRLRPHWLYGVAYSLAGIVLSHRPGGVAEQLLGVVQVFGVGGGLGVQIAELKADACFLPPTVETATEFADAQWLAFLVLDEGEARSGAWAAQAR